MRITKSTEDKILEKLNDIVDLICFNNDSKAKKFEELCQVTGVSDSNKSLKKLSDFTNLIDLLKWESSMAHAHIIGLFLWYILL